MVKGFSVIITIPPNKLLTVSFAAKAKARPPKPRPATKPFTLKPHSSAMMEIESITTTMRINFSIKGIMIRSTWISKFLANVAKNKLVEAAKLYKPHPARPTEAERTKCLSVSAVKTSKGR